MHLNLNLSLPQLQSFFKFLKEFIKHSQIKHKVDVFILRLQTLSLRSVQWMFKASNPDPTNTSGLSDNKTDSLESLEISLN